VSYIFGDVLTEVYGYARARRVIWVGFGCLGISSLIFWIVGIMPGEGSWQGYAGQEAYDKILGGMSTGGIVLSSLLGFFAGEFSNSFVLAKMKILTHGRWLGPTIEAPWWASGYPRVRADPLRCSRGTCSGRSWLITCLKCG
jgi:uncharacterized PurR-regulated membrane protein YhhQ (DUF165 family)